MLAWLLVAANGPAGLIGVPGRRAWPAPGWLIAVAAVVIAAAAAVAGWARV